MSTTMAMGEKTQKILLLAMILAVSMTTIDQTIVALSANTIETKLGISHAAITWSINAYILATAAFFLLGGKLADIYGHRRLVTIGIIAFACFSLLCGLTPSGAIAAPWLITSRAFQGAGAAIMFPAALGIVLANFPLSSRGKAIATFFTLTGAMTAMGPIVGGYLVQWTWRSIFWINIPIALVSLVLIARQSVTDTTKSESIDWKGALLIAVSMTLTIVGLQQAGTWGWKSILTWAFIVPGVALLKLFIFFERGRKSPLVQIASFKDRRFSFSVLATFLSSMAFIPIFFFMSVYAQVSLGLNVITSGLLILELFLGFVVGSRLGARMFDSLGIKRPLILGGALGAIGFAWWASKLGILTHGGAFFSSPQFWPTFIAGTGIGFMFTPASTDVANRIDAQSYGEASGISQTARNFGGALGLALLTAILTTQLTTNLTSSFGRLGAPASAAQSVVKDISSGTNPKKNSQMTTLSESIDTQFTNAVRSGYAESSKSVFYGMSGVMAVVFVLGLLYPHEVKNESHS